MRGAKFLDISHHIIDAILMREYHQPYSEIENIPTESVIFLLRFIEAKAMYEEAELKKAKQQSQKGRGKFK